MNRNTWLLIVCFPLIVIGFIGTAIYLAIRFGWAIAVSIADDI